MATILDAHVGYWAKRKRAASERGRRMALARWRREKVERLAAPPDVDADTVRARALHDRMGTLILAGTHAHRGHVEIRHSTKRTNAYALWIEGRLVAEGGKRRLITEIL